MKVVRYISTLIFLLSSVLTFAQDLTVSGVVSDKDSGEPVMFATVVLESSGQWAVADDKGRFTIKGVRPGKTAISVSCIGYVDFEKEITISKSIENFKVQLSEDNLALDGAVITAKEGSGTSTSRTIDRTALDHVQVMNVADISSLLPGGSTTNPTLTSDQNFNIRAGSNEVGNSSFGTALEVDGVRISNNASFSGASTTSTNLKGATTNSIASSNVESVEVITGVPSVEYGDMTSGVVKVNTRKGKTPWTVTMSTNPSIKQISAGKGFDLGRSRKGASAGVLNATAELTKSISEPMSPYTAYNRRQVTLTYSNLLSRGIFSETPLRFTAGFTGNLGGLDSSADPDAMKDTWSRNNDNALRGNISFDWLLNKSWITNLEFKASASWADKSTSSNSYYFGAASTFALHATEVGYYMSAPYTGGQVPGVIAQAPGHWYNTMREEDKPLTARASIKANWADRWGSVNSRMKVGVDWSMDQNLGRGAYTDDIATAPSFREYIYSDIPAMNNFAAYAEEDLMIPVGRDGRINLVAGVRNDNTIINNSAYGITSSVSPRFNGKYTAFTEKSRRNALLKEFSIRAGWGVAVKQPSFAVLYPAPSYQEINIFTSTADAAGNLSRAYFVLPRTIEYNPSLRWQRAMQSEVGIDMNLGGNKISIVGFMSRTADAYRLISDYERFTYNYTPTSSVQGLSIPVTDRVFTVNPANGTITVSDATGANPSLEAAFTTRKQFTPKTLIDNDDNPVNRYGVEWVVDFARIAPINTTVRLDGKWYSYKSLYTDMRAYSPYNTAGADGMPYSYIGYYYGDYKISNGSSTSSLNTNVTLTTHIPAARLIFSVKLESTLMKRSRSLGDRLDGSARSQVLADRQDFLSANGVSIYAGDNYTALYPDFYSTYDDPTPKDFLEALRWAKANDPALYADLSKLVVTSSYTYYFKQDSISPYYSANFSVTKEISKLASISFYANNFFNNMAQVYSKKTGNYSQVSSYIPRFYYGLTVRIKFN